VASKLSPSVLGLIEMSPIEDLLLALLRDALPDTPVQTLIETRQVFPFVMLRSTGSWGNWEGDERFIDSSTIEIHTFCDGINADSDANLLSEAVRVILRDSKNKVVPGKGYLIAVEMLDRPKRSPDWATSVGPVQYADLPTGVERWETTYKVTIRKPAIKPYAP
jgi:hypothetical protein